VLRSGVPLLKFTLAASCLVALLLPGPVLAAPAEHFVWVDPNGHPNASARDALRLLADAAAEGLSASDYLGADLIRSSVAAGDADEAAPSSPIAFERSMDRAMQRYLHDLHFGRIDPRSVGFRVPRRADAAADFTAALHAAAGARQLPRLVADLRPRVAQYERLREALARYRALAARRPADHLTAARPVRPGEALADAAALHRLLVGFGDLPANAPLPAGRYDSSLAQGVGRFQERHGLLANQVIDRATLAALNTPPAQRVRQLELALERLRWLPDLAAGRFIGINIPMFRLWAWDAARPADAAITMSVVVGKALNTRTPVLSDELRYLVFRPYWNVPRSIMTRELLPAMTRDAGYLQRNDMEIVRGDGDDARVVAAGSEAFAMLREGTLRVRQRPGPKNSLGLVKFIFPNDDNVYLHGTPATRLFGQTRRDFSHGCVRVQDPVTLAQWVLRDPDWTRQHVEQAMAGPTPLRVKLAEPIPVILFYMTAMVVPSDHALHFAPDIYGHDTALLRALAARRRGP
jgi:murein L,D-transpeptidase YcbB/YkuD